MFMSTSGRTRGRRSRIAVLVATVATGVCLSNLTQASPVAAAPGDLIDTTVDALSPSAAPSGDLPGWRQIFVDNFSTDVALGDFPEAVSGKWRAYPSPWPDSTGHGTYSPHETVSIRNGVLNEHIHTAGGRPRIAALVPKLPGTSKFGRTYGRFAVRFRADVLPAYKIAWMLWPDSGHGSQDGEIDFPERNLDGAELKGYMHYTDSQFPGDQARVVLPFDGTQWHTTVIEWSPNLVRFLLDGVEVRRVTQRIPDTPMHWVMQTETKISPPTIPSPSVSGNVQIDWVAAWAYGNQGPGPDETPPTVSLTSVANGAVVDGSVSLAAHATDASEVTAVKWYVDGVETGYDGGVAPWADLWNTASLSNGEHTLMAKARDEFGNWGTSPKVSVTVRN